MTLNNNLTVNGTTTLTGTLTTGANVISGNGSGLTNLTPDFLSIWKTNTIPCGANVITNWNWNAFSSTNRFAVNLISGLFTNQDAGWYQVAADFDYGPAAGSAYFASVSLYTNGVQTGLFGGGRTLVGLANAVTNQLAWLTPQRIYLQASTSCSLVIYSTTAGGSNQVAHLSIEQKP